MPNSIAPSYEPVAEDTLVRRIAVIDPDSAYDARERHDRAYEFDRVFDETASNDEVYAVTVSPLVAAVRRGMNATCFAYGMTGAGKTYTMGGDQRKGVRGICSLAAEDLFDSTLQGGGDGDVVQTVHVSFLELYNERLRDLLVEDPSGPTGPARRGTFGHEARSSTSRGAAGAPAAAKRLDIVEDPSKGVSVTNLTELLVTSVDQLEILMAESAARRVMASTTSNVASSRSHALLQLTVRRHRGDEITTGRLQLIDLAGSERAVSRSSAAWSVYGDGFGQSGLVEENAKQAKLRNEGANINRSLLALGACISALGNAASATSASSLSLSHVPYRDSKLTRLLKESLGGNTRTAMIAAISPSCLCYEETLSTLKYAAKARLITRTVRRNTVENADLAREYAPVIAALEDEVQALRAQVAMSAGAVRSAAVSTVGSPSPQRISHRQSAERSPITAVARPVKDLGVGAARLRLADLKAQFALVAGRASERQPTHSRSASAEVIAPAFREPTPASSQASSRNPSPGFESLTQAAEACTTDDARRTLQDVLSRHRRNQPGGALALSTRDHNRSFDKASSGAATAALRDIVNAKYRSAFPERGESDALEAV
jgi:kinesin family protein 18/19